METPCGKRLRPELDALQAEISKTPIGWRVWL